MMSGLLVPMKMGVSIDLAIYLTSRIGRPLKITPRSLCTFFRFGTEFPVTMNEMAEHKSSSYAVVFTTQ